MSLFSELAKRRVFTTGAIYIPAAWLGAEILLAAFDRFDAPAWAGDTVVVMFLLGFPVALLLSWQFDVTPEGVKRASPATPLGILSLLASGLFLSVGAYVSFQVFSGALEEISVAILPLQPHAASPDAQPYGYGIADGLRNSLREIPTFRVPARTSSEAVLAAGMDIPAIARRLGVKFVLEGTVQAVGERFNIDVTLLDDRGDVLWSERYQKELRDLFDLQDELTIVVATRLGISDSHPVLVQQAGDAPPTRDPEAYRLYLRGKYSVQMLGQAEGGARLKLLNQARNLDPGFAEVYIAIAQEYANECWALDDRGSPSCELAVNFASQGLQLDPALADALATLALVHSVRYEYQLAQDAIDRFYALDSHPIVSQALPWAFLNLGRLQEAWDAANLFYRNDPLNMFALGSITLWSWALRGDLELMDHYDQMLVEIMGTSLLAGYPDRRVHRVPLEQAIQEGRQISVIWQANPDAMDVVIPAFYDPALKKQAADKLEAMFERGEVRAAQYWGYMAGLGRVDDYMNAAFGMFDERIFNPVFLWMNAPGNEKMRNHPRYFELLDYIGIAAYWDQVGWPEFCGIREGERHCNGKIRVD